MATESNPYSGAYNRTATAALPAADGSLPALDPNWEEKIKQGVAGAYSIFLGGATAENGWQVQSYAIGPDGTPSIIPREFMERIFMKPLTTLEGNAPGASEPMSWMSAPDSPARIAFLDRYYPGLLDQYFGANPAWSQKLNEVRQQNGQVPVDPKSPGLPPNWTPPPGTPIAPSQASKKGNPKVKDARTTLGPGEVIDPRSPYRPLGPGQVAAIRRRGSKLSNGQLNKRINALGNGGVDKVTGGQQRLQALQNVAVNRAVGPMKQNQRDLFQKVRERREAGKTVSEKTQQKLKNIKEKRANAYTQATGNTYYRTGYRKPKTGDKNLAYGPKQVGSGGGLTR